MNPIPSSCLSNLHCHSLQMSLMCTLLLCTRTAAREAEKCTTRRLFLCSDADHTFYGNPYILTRSAEKKNRRNHIWIIAIKCICVESANCMASYSPLPNPSHSFSVHRLTQNPSKRLWAALLYVYPPQLDLMTRVLGSSGRGLKRNRAEN